MPRQLALFAFSLAAAVGLTAAVGFAQRPSAGERISPPRQTGEADADWEASQTTPTLALSPPARQKQPKSDDQSHAPWLTTFGSLAVVLSVLFAVAWLIKKVQPAGTSRLPTDCLELLGHQVLAGRHQLHLVRVGEKLLLVAVSQNQISTLTEIEQPAQVARLCELARRPESGGRWQQALQQLQSGSVIPFRAEASSAPRDSEAGSDV